MYSFFTFISGRCIFKCIKSMEVFNLMARGRKSYTTEEKIELTQNKIGELTDELKSLKAELKELQTIKEQEDLKALKDLITESGKSIDEVKAILALKKED